MPCPPVAGNIDPGCDPHVIQLLDMIEEATQRRRPARPADEPAMQSDRHHAVSVMAKYLEAVPQIPFKLFT